MFTSDMCPNKCNEDHYHQPCDAFHVAHMGVLDVESGRYKVFEKRLKLPAPLICLNCTLRSVEAYQDLKFRNSIRVLDFTSGKILILPIAKKEFTVKFLLSDTEIIEKPPCPNRFSGGRFNDSKILSYPHVVLNPHIVKPSDSFLADELFISHKLAILILFLINLN